MIRSRTSGLGTSFSLASLMAGVAASVCMLSGTADARAIPDAVTVAENRSPECSERIFEPAIAAPARTGVRATKSAAILGGQPSALDLIRQQQAQVAESDTAPVHSLSITPSITATGAATCPTFALATASANVAITPAASESDNFLGTARVGIRSTPFNDDWDRVSSGTVSRTMLTREFGGSARVNLHTLGAVNRWANNRIAYVEDMANYGSRDYWATAIETLKAGKGDCEDYAILKYQMLAALGFDRSSMYLTLARDLVRNADHAVLVVKIEGRHYLLDNATDALLPANIAYDYRPTISFNSESAWLHGSGSSPRIASLVEPREFAYLSDSAVSSALLTGFNR